MDLKEIQNLIKFVARSGASEVKLETGDFKITIRTGAVGDDSRSEASFQQGTPVATTIIPQMPVQQAPQPAAPQQPAAEAAEDSKYVVIKSPIIGTFYRKPSPDKPMFVEVGSTIQKGDVLCVIEAMKLFNEIESEISGKIVKILVDDSSPVEFDQPLFLVDPA
jgi:acetyl-CoA carboxylase biotin carboxyl carrier protein